MSRRAKAKVKNQKALKKEKDQKGPQAIRNLQKGRSKGKGKTKSKGKGQWTTWSWNQNQNQNWNQNQGDQKGKKAKMGKARPIVRYVANQVIKLINAGGTISNKGLILSNHLRTQGKFTISQSILRINPFRLYNQINSEVSRSMTCGSTTSTTKSESSIHCAMGPASSVLSHSGQVGGFSGHRLNINHFTQPVSSESGSKRFVLHFLTP